MDKDKYQKKLKHNREYACRLRTAVFDILGARCSKCGFSDIRALQIDHINGGGSKQRKVNGGRYIYSLVLRNIEEGKNDYQILCANCNWIKRVINNENRK